MSNPRQLRGQLTSVEIHRDSLSSPWGFRLRGGRDFNEPLVVQKVQPLSAAEEYLKPGDVILQIRDKDAKFLTHAEALAVLKEAGSILRLLILRPTSSTPRQSNFDAPVKTATRSALSPSESEPPIEDEVPRNNQLADIMKQSLMTQNRYGKYQSLPRPSTFKFQHQQQQQTRSTSVSPTSTSTSFNYHYDSNRRGRSTNITDTRIRNQIIKDSITRSSPSTSSRNSPVPNYLSSGDGDKYEDALKYGITVPPTQRATSTPTLTPTTVRQLVHLQYNSPMMMYSPTNIVDTFNKNLQAIP
ncbi:unnamed protein product [Soboliphyme baturini]|uniref:PDZ domain-containing protein n=1 Tax=Soboliphyme baturini TaxID=241478 RepID=A0A183IGN5_9BILA|nr:unnamed protein product [Soboliphyme baturini]